VAHRVCGEKTFRFVVKRWRFGRTAATYHRIALYISARLVMKIAAAQISCAPGDFKTNLGKIREFASLAKDGGADLVVFPEMVDTGYSMPVIQKQAKAWADGAVPELEKIAKATAIAIASGVSERDGKSIYNAQVIIDAKGEVVAKYRKTHLVTAAPLDERICISPGNEFVTFSMAGFKFGLSICYDLRFPEMCRTLVVRHQANVLINSSAWPFPRMEHLRILALSRAIENQSYLILANRVGRDDGVPFCGSSAIIDPYGVIVAAASADREELIQAEIAEEVINSVRSRMAVFDHRRGDLY
jgi:omega-amidase